MSTLNWFGKQNVNLFPAQFWIKGKRSSQRPQLWVNDLYLLVVVNYLLSPLLTIHTYLIHSSIKISWAYNRIQTGLFIGPECDHCLNVYPCQWLACCDSGWWSCWCDIEADIEVGVDVGVGESNSATAFWRFTDRSELFGHILELACFSSLFLFRQLLWQ